MSIVTETLQLAKASKLKKSEICKAANVKRRWYYRFLNGDYKEPGAQKIERLYNVFKAERLHILLKKKR